MANAKPAEGPTCMTCGVPIKSGFFCARCAAGDTPDQREGNKKEEGWKGSRFSGEAKKKKQKALLMEDLTIWGKRVLILAIVGIVGFVGYSLFGDRVRGMIQGAESVGSKPKYDPTKDASTNEDDQASGKNGSRAFSKGTQ